MDLQLALEECRLAAHLAPDVRWGASLGGAEASLLPQNATLSRFVFFLNDSGAQRLTVLAPATWKLAGFILRYEFPGTRHLQVSHTNDSSRSMV